MCMDTVSINHTVPVSAVRDFANARHKSSIINVFSREIIQHSKSLLLRKELDNDRGEQQYYVCLKTTDSV